MLGYTEKEGIWRANYITPDLGDATIWADFWTNSKDTIPLALGLFNQTSDVRATMESIMDFYDLNKMDKTRSVPESQVEGYVDAQSDSMFIYGIDATAKLHSKYAERETYFYYMKFHGAHSLANFRSDGSASKEHPMEIMR